MRLLELLGYKKQPVPRAAPQPVSQAAQDPLSNSIIRSKAFINDPTSREFRRQAEKAGWTVIGRGGAGVVLGKAGSKEVYKLFYDNPGNHGYLAYTEFVKANPNNPYVPKITFGPIKLENTTTDELHPKDLYLVKMEKLSPVKNTNDMRFEQYIDKKHKRTDTDTHHLDLDEEPSLFDHAMASLEKHDKNFKKIYNFAGASIDLGPENVMFRDNQLVLIDPMA